MRHDSKHFMLLAQTNKIHVRLETINSYAARGEAWDTLRRTTEQDEFGDLEGEAVVGERILFSM